MDQLLTSDESSSDSGGSTSTEDLNEDLASEIFEEDASDDDLVDDWRLVDEATDERPGQVPEFLGIPGVSLGTGVEGRGALEYFRKFLSETIIDRLTDFTNARAWEELRLLEEERLDGDQRLPPVLADWRNCSVNGIEKTVAIIFYMGIVRKPEIQSYWATSKFHDNQLFQSENCLSRNRFQQILSFLRFYDCRVADEGDPLRKIRPFSNDVRQVCQQNFMPNRDLAVDEELVLHKGRLAFKQYIPTKRARYGIKTYCLCDSRTGYLWNVLVHSTAEENNKFGAKFAAHNLSITERIVAELSKDLLNLGYRIYIDSYFCSLRLATFLLEHNTLVTGTVRCNRGIPPELQQVHLAAPSHSYMQNGDVLAVKMTDRKASGIKTLYLLDSFGKASSVQRQRIRRGGQVELVRKPVSVMDYSRSMGGVDKLDSALQPYHPTRKMYRWHQKLGIHFLLQLAHNSWIAYQLSGGSSKFLPFMEQLVIALIDSSGRGKKRCVRPAPEVAGPAHLPCKLPATPGNQRPARRCRVCYRQGRDKRTVFICGQCPSQPGLCVPECFRVWHG